MPDSLEDLRFSDPPVREVTLNVLLENMPALSSLDLATFRTANTAAYPHSEELAPLQAWDDDAEPRPLVSGQTKWPVPLCILSNLSKERQLFFQADRFGVSWSFGLDAPGYPGFKALLTELLEGFEAFSAGIEESGNSRPVVRRLNIRYTNELNAIAPDDMINALLNGWPLPENRKPPRIGMTSARFHQCESALDDDISLLFIVDPIDDDGDERFVTDHAAHTSGSSVFRIGGDLDLDPAMDLSGQFKRLHLVVLKEFLESMGEEAVQKWGRE